MVGFCSVVSESQVLDEISRAAFALLLKEPLELEDGYLRVPTGPGLGLELDDAKIEEFRTAD